MMFNDDTNLEDVLPKEDMPAAEFLIDAISKHQQAIENARSVANAIIEARKQEVSVWLDKAVATEQAQIDRLEPLLRNIVERKTKGTRLKSISLPSGRAGFRSVEPTFYFHGEKANASNSLFVATIACKGDSPFIHSAPVLDWTAMKKSLHVASDGTVCTEDGEIIKGLTATINPDRFFVKKACKTA